MAARGKVPKVMAAPKTWTDREVLDLVRAVLAVRDAGLMQRMQNVWAGGDSAGLSPLSDFFKGQARRYDLFGFGHEDLRAVLGADRRGAGGPRVRAGAGEDRTAAPRPGDPADGHEPSRSRSRGGVGSGEGGRALAAARGPREGGG